MKQNVVFDSNTGITRVIGRDGRTYSPDEVETARRQARGGDADAQAVVDNIDMTADWADMDPREILRQQLHDCPECRAAMARGEVPTFAPGFHIPPPRPKRWAKPRWRDLKRRR